MTNLRVIWGRVAAIRADFTIERLEQVFAEFQDKGLLFVWEHEGKRYAHWTGSDVPGRLPPPSWRMRLERFAPPVPRQKLAEYIGKFARGRAALAGVGFRGDGLREPAIPKRDSKFEFSEMAEDRSREGRAPSAQLNGQRSLFTGRGDDCGARNFRMKGNGETEGRVANSQFDGDRQAAAGAVGGRDGIGHGCAGTAVTSGLKVRVEENQADDLGLDWNLDEKWEMEGNGKQVSAGDAQSYSRGLNQEKEFLRTHLNNSSANSSTKQNSNAKPPLDSNSRSGSPGLGESQSPTMPSLSRGSREGCTESAEGALPALKSGHSSEVQGGNRPMFYAGTSAWREKELAVERELRVGQGPVCGPARVKPEVLERIRRREAARAGSRSP
jgi:hypothetical protein